MAIIYTYPPVLAPDGTELIVVTETKNRNATRLITLAGICDFCGENVGCPTTYLLKPVTCSDGACEISGDSSTWITTCEPEFAPLLGKYVTVTNNGIAMYHGGNPANTCYFVDSLPFNPLPTETSCELCCDPPIINTFTLTECPGGAGRIIYVDTSSVTTPDPAFPIDAYLGEMVVVTTVGYEGCYTVSAGGGLPAIVLTIETPIGTFTECCPIRGAGENSCDYKYNREYSLCGDPTTVIVVTLPNFTAWNNAGTPGNAYNVIQTVGGGGTICWEAGDTTCDPATDEILNTAPLTCGDEAYCDSEATIWKLSSCGGHVTAAYYTITDLSAYDTQTIQTNGTGTVEAGCWTVSQESGTPIVPFDIATEIVSVASDCSCCGTPYRSYEVCGDPGTYFHIDLTEYGFTTTPDCVKYDPSGSGEYTCGTLNACDTTGTLVTSPTVVIVCDPDCDDDPDCPSTEVTYYDWKLCEADWDGTDGDQGYCTNLQLPTKDGAPITPTTDCDGTVYQYLDLGDIRCIQFRVRDEIACPIFPGVAAPPPVALVNGIVTTTNPLEETECECCEGTYIYQKCGEGFCGATPLLDPFYHIDPDKFGSPLNPPTMIKLTDGTGTDTCCYTLNEEATCVREIDGVFDQYLHSSPDTLPVGFTITETTCTDCTTCTACTAGCC